MVVATKRIAVTEDTFNRIMAMAHYGQTLNGVIKELLDNINCNYINDINKLLSAGSLKKCNKHNILYLGFEECPQCIKESDVK